MNNLELTFKGLKKGALIYISLDEDLPEEKMRFLLAEFIELYFHSGANEYYAKMLIVDSFDRWSVKVNNTVHYGIHKITKVVEAPPEEYILYRLEEEGDGKVHTKANG